MKTKFKMFVFFFACFLLPACKKSENGITNVKNIGITLRVVGESKFLIDSLTLFSSRYINYGEFEGQETLAILNSDANRLQVYSEATGELIWALDYYTSGENSIGIKGAYGFYIENKESIYLFDGWKGVLSRVNSQGVILNRYDFAPNGVNTGYAFPVVSTLSPIHYSSNHFTLYGIIPGIWRKMRLQNEVMLSYDIENDTLRYSLQRPKLNTEFNWGDGLMNFVYYDFIDSLDQFIVSFANSENLMLIDNNGIVQKELQTESIFFDSVEPLMSDYNRIPDPELTEKYFFSEPRYWGVIHDPYRGVTYRVTQYPFDKALFKDGMRKMKSSIIILDRNFQKIGEQDIDPDEYDLKMMYVNKDGLNIASKKKFKVNEEVLTFDIFDFYDKVR
ncbi:hypothetical protein [Roseivirga misakiensis]|uniref:DUF4221 domain-containing protein n=1 Tax=Roseivirga misakiensis TaxID=1563681 RepID=A0A1E5SYX6_9BACT|nr:hypothetical protein [Roseivirga misakiensis]OEK04334.1 hypothetical protein BFP71_12690 [Roseivirga misakiensis]